MSIVKKIIKSNKATNSHYFAYNTVLNHTCNACSQYLLTKIFFGVEVFAK